MQSDHTHLNYLTCFHLARPPCPPPTYLTYIITKSFSPKCALVKTNSRDSKARSVNIKIRASLITSRYRSNIQLIHKQSCSVLPTSSCSRERHHHTYVHQSRLLQRIPKHHNNLTVQWYARAQHTCTTHAQQEIALQHLQTDRQIHRHIQCVKPSHDKTWYRETYMHGC